MAKQGANDGQVWAKRRRAAVLRFMTHLNQVGQSGSTPRHEPGRQLRLSARQTDVLYVADAFEAMRHVNGLPRA